MSSRGVARLARPPRPEIASWCSDRSSRLDRRSISLGYSSPMDSRAKQRLTGAVILAALFVLLVPELLTGPKSSTAPAAPPEEEQGLRSYTIEIDGKSETSSTPQVAQPVPVAPIPAPDNDDVAAPQVAESAPARQPEQRAAAEEITAGRRGSN